MEKKKTFKELFAGTGIEPTTDENGGVHYNFNATLKTKEVSDKAILLTPKGTLTIGEEYSSPSISFYKNDEVENVITIKYTKFMYKGEEVKDLQTIYDIIKSLTSIKLPSDEEINEKANLLQDEKDGDTPKQINKMETPLQNLKYYFRNDETITKEELLTAIDELIDNERAFFCNAFEHGYASSGLVAIEQNKAFEAYGKLYNACNP
jgi:hypothetical protein